MKVLISSMLFLLSLASIAQKASSDYPQGYFRNPLDIPISLSGNFGELRSNHYHMGLDLKTNAKVNLPVYAAADGYVARIKIEPGGFGRAIYINHPNGYTTLYAHLNGFMPALEKWLERKQYELESWNVSLDLTPDLFPVRKGQFIANSGNTGGSQGPHLHFEIRRTSDDVNLNPMLFRFPIADNVKPRIIRLGIYDRQKSIYEQSPRLFPLKAAPGGLITTPSLIKVSSPMISFAVTAYDTHTGSSNLNGIFSAELFQNDLSIVSFEMDKISYNDTRYMNAHIDYRTKSGGGAYLQHLSELPGYYNSIYAYHNGNGVIDISDGKIHDFKITVRDAYGNISNLSYRVQYDGTGKPPVLPVVNGRKFYPLMLDGFESDNCEFYIGEKCLYDSVTIRYHTTKSTHSSSASDLHHIGNSYIPLQEAFLIRIRPTLNPDSEFRTRTVMQWISGTRKAVQKVEWQGEWAAGRFRDFGAYQLLVDTIPPQIVPANFSDGSNLSKASQILFSVRDNLEKVNNVRVELDGKWLRFTNDKGRNFIYRFDERCPPGKHTLKITAEDEAGNSVVREYEFLR